MPRRDPPITVIRIYEPDRERMVRALRIFLFGLDGASAGRGTARDYCRPGAGVGAAEVPAKPAVTGPADRTGV